MRMLTSLLATASFVAVFSTPLLAAEEAVLLPVRSVVLYKNGMGYFEHLGKVPDGQAVEISLPAAQLDDVLKSLTVLDLGRGGSIGGVTYESTAPLDRRLAELPIDLGSVNGLTAFLNKIRGAEVELRAPSGAVAGRLMGAEVRSRTVERTSIEVVEAMVLTGAGEVRIVPMESVSALRLLDAALARDLARYLDLVSGSRRSDVRRLRIRAGVGERQLHLSYTSEAPIWKSTYRIVLDSKQKPLLQGWAIVDNTTPLDWNDVTVALVAGAPVSFVQRLSQPVYARRPVVPLPAGVQVTPQVHEGMIDDAEKKQEAGRLSYAAPPPPATAMAPAAPEESSAQMLRANVGGMMRATAPETAVGQALAEQFEYRFPERITIRKNESALLPILQTELEAQKVSVYSAASGERRARLAVWLKNTSGLTLDGGAFTVIDENAFAGEGLAETIQPGESRLLSYALDLAVAVSSQLGSEQSSVQQIDINRGVLRMHSKLIERRSYVVRNNDARARTLVVEHPIRAGWSLVETRAPAEKSPTLYRFKVDVAPKSTTELVVREESPQATTYALSDVTPGQVSLWLRERQINVEVERALGAIMAKKSEVSDLATRIAAFEREQAEIFKDQERVRGNLQRLGSSPDEASLRQRYIRQLEAEETRLATIRAERDKLEASRVVAQRQLGELIGKLSLERKL